MTENSQATISGERATFNDLIFKAAEHPINQTLGGRLHQQYSPMRRDINIIEYALLSIDQSKPESMVSTAFQILLSIQSTVDSFRQSGVGPDHLPQVRAYAPDDDSISIEWNFDNFRIGFNIEEVASENSWYLISNNLGEVSASGYIRPGDIESIILWLLSFITLSYWG